MKCSRETEEGTGPGSNEKLKRDFGAAAAEKRLNSNLNKFFFSFHCFFFVEFFVSGFNGSGPSALLESAAQTARAKR